MTIFAILLPMFTLSSPARNSMLRTVLLSAFFRAAWYVISNVLSEVIAIGSFEPLLVRSLETVSSLKLAYFMRPSGLAGVTDSGIAGIVNVNAAGIVNVSSTGVDSVAMCCNLCLIVFTSCYCWEVIGTSLSSIKDPDINLDCTDNTDNINKVKARKTKTKRTRKRDSMKDVSLFSFSFSFSLLSWASPSSTADEVVLVLRIIVD